MLSDERDTKPYMVVISKVSIQALLRRGVSCWRAYTAVSAGPRKELHANSTGFAGKKWERQVASRTYYTNRSTVCWRQDGCYGRCAPHFREAPRLRSSIAYTSPKTSLRKKKEMDNPMVHIGVPSIQRSNIARHEWYSNDSGLFFSQGSLLS